MSESLYECVRACVRDRALCVRACMRVYNHERVVMLDSMRTCVYFFFFCDEVICCLKEEKLNNNGLIVRPFKLKKGNKGVQFHCF